MAKEPAMRPMLTPVEDFLARVTPAERVTDARVLIDLMARLTGEPAVMWGPTIIGFGQTTYDLAGGRTGLMPKVGFSPRKPQLVFYIGGAANDAACARLGKATHGVSCVYAKRLADIDMDALESLIRESLN